MYKLIILRLKRVNCVKHEFKFSLESVVSRSCFQVTYEWTSTKYYRQRNYFLQNFIWKPIMLYKSANPNNMYYLFLVVIITFLLHKTQSTFYPHFPDYFRHLNFKKSVINPCLFPSFIFHHKSKFPLKKKITILTTFIYDTSSFLSLKCII